MATNVVVMRTIYQVLGCSLGVAEYLLGEEELEICEDLAELNPFNAHQLCKNVRNPRGGK